MMPLALVAGGCHYFAMVTLSTRDGLFFHVGERAKERHQPTTTTTTTTTCDNNKICVFFFGFNENDDVSSSASSFVYSTSSNAFR